MDQRMRALERAAAAGDAAAEEALLRRRLGMGDLAWRKLRIAAYLGHPPAERAFARRLRGKDQRVDKWMRGLVHYGGQQAQSRITLALAEAALRRFEQDAPGDGRPRAALEAARAFLACPCDEHGRQAVRAGEHAWHAGDDLAERAGVRPSSRGPVHHGGAQAARAVAYAGRELSGRAYYPMAWTGGTCAGLAEDLLGPQRLRFVVRRALLAWALDSEGCR